MGRINLAFHSMYSIPSWSGGPYGTVKDAGSQSVVNAAHAFLALLAMGRDTYAHLAVSVNKTSKDVAALLDEYDEIDVLATPAANVVAFALSPATQEKWGKGAICK
jgi:glutamate/tyrosine decarboxylase-like PLP-dependent enzyme